jgi:hypothetical protein
VPAVFVRSRARIRRFAALNVGDGKPDAILERLALMLSGRAGTDGR